MSSNNSGENNELTSIFNCVVPLSKVPNVHSALRKKNTVYFISDNYIGKKAKLLTLKMQIILKSKT